MKIKGFEGCKGDYFIGRYVEYWKSGSYFHKKVCFERCKYDNHSGYLIMIFPSGICKGYLEYLGHNLEVIEQFKTLEELNETFKLCKNYNEY